MRFASFGRFGAWLGTVAILMTFGSSGVAQTLDRIRNEGAIKLGYVMDERPFSFQDDAGAPTGYAVSLCTMVVEQIKGQLGLDGLALQWVPLDAAGSLDAVRTGAVDLLCGANTVTLTNREIVSYSISIFPSGTGALVRNDAQLALREVLVQGQPSTRPIWRGSPARTVLEHKTFSAVAGTTSESWLERANSNLPARCHRRTGSQLCRGDRRGTRWQRERPVRRPTDPARCGGASRKIRQPDRIGASFHPRAFGYSASSRRRRPALGRRSRPQRLLPLGWLPRVLRGMVRPTRRARGDLLSANDTSRIAAAAQQASAVSKPDGS